MGKLFQTNTWRAPLRLIECWLPEPEHTARRVQPTTSGLIDKFSRAGWLRGHAANAPRLVSATNESTPSAPLQSSRVRVVWTRDQHTRASARVVVAGRISDVCAELDRLAELERKQALAA